MHPALQKILIRSAVPELLNVLTERISGGQLTTLLLEVYRQRISKMRPSDLLENLPQNRFVQPSGLDPILLREAELMALRLGRKAGFELIELGPVSPLGSSAVYGRVHQNNILSALRNCEVIADPSNLLCLLMASKIGRSEGEVLHWLCSHRTLRTARHEGPGRMAHFQLLAACSLIYSREQTPILKQVHQHLDLQEALFKQLGLKDLKHTLWIKNQRRELGELLFAELKQHPEVPCNLSEASGSDYYQGFQLKTYALYDQEWVELADLGLVNWASELKGDKYLNCLTSGIGLERMLAMP